MSPEEVQTEREVANRTKGEPIDDPPFTTEKKLPNGHEMKETPAGEEGPCERCSDGCAVFDKDGNPIPRPGAAPPEVAPPEVAPPEVAPPEAVPPETTPTATPEPTPETPPVEGPPTETPAEPTSEPPEPAAEPEVEKPTEPGEKPTETEPETKASKKDEFADRTRKKLDDIQKQKTDVESKIEELKAERSAAELDEARAKAAYKKEFEGGTPESKAQAKERWNAAKEKLGTLEAEDELGGARAEKAKLEQRAENLENSLKEGTYDRPGFRAGKKAEVWANAPKTANGGVIDPSGKEILPGDPWEMGHEPGYEFWKHQQSAMERGIPREQFIKEYNDADIYRPELPETNHSHAYEAPDHVNHWP
jgi:hypothetical protein